MKNRKVGRWYLPACFVLELLLACSGAAGQATDIVEMAGSTPGDAVVKAIFKIPVTKEIDFMKWQLLLHNNSNHRKTFTLQLNYGVSEPNTSGFTKQSAEFKNFSGIFETDTIQTGKLKGELLRLKSEQFSNELSLIKINENLYHILTPDQQLMTGNGGWSYSISRKNPVVEKSKYLPFFASASIGLNDTTQMVFIGRTPCQDFAAEFNVNAAQECFKLKWKLVLKKDPLTGAPANFWLRNVIYNKVADVEGKWSIIKGNASHPDLIFIQLHPDQPAKSMTFLRGDQHVLFLMHKDGTVFAGNADFGYALNLDR